MQRKGHKKDGGRKKGTPNKFKFNVAETAKRLQCDPFEIMCNIANGKLACCVCFGTGRTKYKKSDGVVGERICESCYGTLKEKISPGDRLKAAEALGRRLAPELKAIEVTRDPSQSANAMTLEQYLAVGAMLLKVQ